jgi:hypothetical protein
MEKQNRNRRPFFSRFALRGLLCAYALYMGYTFLKEHFLGTATVQPLLSWLFGLGFLAFGMVYGIFTWRAYKTARDAASLPPAPEEGRGSEEETGSSPEAEEPGNEDA